MRFAAPIAAALLLSAAPAMAADLCQAVSASHSQRYLLDGTSGGSVQIAKPAAFPADVRAFVVASDPTFQDQKFDIFPLGADGAGLAVHYEGSEAENYLNMTAATIGGVPALFLNQEKSGETVIRITPWQDHQWGAICELKTATRK